MEAATGGGGGDEEEQQMMMISSFLEIAVGQTPHTARQFLQATSWQLDEALQLFYVGNEGQGGGKPHSNHDTNNNATNQPDASASASASTSTSTSTSTSEALGNQLINQQVAEVRAPLPVVRETLYDAALMPGSVRMPRPGFPQHGSSSFVAFRNFDQEVKRPGVWESDQGGPSAKDYSQDNLASLYRPPFHLMFNGSFEKAKDTSSVQDKWLLVNLQSTKEFSSHMLNRDTWANEAVSQMVATNFIFWQVYDDTTEGQKVCTYYKLSSIPVVLVIDPITGQKMRSWTGMVQPESLLEDLVPFMDGGPRDHHATLSNKRPRESSTPPPQKLKGETNEEDDEMLRAIAASMEGLNDSTLLAANDKEEALLVEEATPSIEKPVYPALPEEPKVDRNLLCRVGIRLPDGRRVQRNFLRTDPIQLLWSFCSSQLEETETRLFQLTQAIPGATKCLDYNSNLTFGESGLANSMISVTWE
ncbi:hypothetical protein ACFE04_029574 [Oxalis oulophora]